MKYVAGIAILIFASVACGRGPDRKLAASPTSPTAAFGDVNSFAGGVSGPMDVLFPSRAESFLFRGELELKYGAGLGRSAIATTVDKEGEVVWMQEYIRYRTNGCDHNTALTRVLAQIDGGAASGICAAPPENSLIVFPPRTDVFEMRRVLELKYQQMGRGLTSSFLDQEGAGVWIPEYLRYRTNACDHSTAVSKVFSQIDGGPVTATCFVQTCAYALNPGGINSNYLASSQSLEVRPNPGGCAWTATSDASWLTIAPGFNTGTGFTVVPYTIAVNNGGARTGRIRVAWTGGGATYVVNQDGIPFVASFTMFDPFQSVNVATECHFRASSTPCNFTASANLPGGNYVFQWTANYVYGIEKTITQSSGSSTFSFSDVCGASGSSTDGPTVPLNVTLVVTDDQGNSITLRSGEGNQPALSVRLFACGT
jgi:hypothetical protein